MLVSLVQCSKLNFNHFHYFSLSLWRQIYPEAGTAAYPVSPPLLGRIHPGIYWKFLILLPSLAAGFSAASPPMGIISESCSGYLQRDICLCSLLPCVPLDLPCCPPGQGSRGKIPADGRNEHSSSTLFHCGSPNCWQIFGSKGSYLLTPFPCGKLHMVIAPACSSLHPVLTLMQAGCSQICS